MVRFVFRLLTPLLLFSAVMMYLAEFRPASVVLVLGGYAAFLVSEELRESS